MTDDGRQIGDNSHGFSNEDKLVEDINGKAYDELTNALKEFIDFAAAEEQMKFDKKLVELYARKEKNNKLKQDLYITIDGHEFGISLKIGSGNSIHQEKCEDFIDYIKKEFNASDEICNSFRLYLWGDGTTDGTGSLDKDDDGKIICRFGARDFYKLYTNEFQEMQDFLDSNSEKLANHFLAEGKYNSNVQFVYHGDSDDAVWASVYDLIKMNLNKKKKEHLSIGNMTLQPWNASLHGTCEQKRGQLQVKYGQLKRDIQDACREYRRNIGLYEGNSEEYNLSRVFNKNKDSVKWDILLNDLSINDTSNVYMVKVSDFVRSKLSGKPVRPKSDAYLISCPSIDKKFLLEREYHIEEKDLKGLDYKKIPRSGISIKLNGSTRYTIQKFTVNSFLEAFKGKLDNPLYVCWGLLIYSNENEKYKNYIIADDLGIDIDQLHNYYFSNFYSNIDFNDVEVLSKIRKWAQKQVKDAIINSDLHKKIFTGVGWFQEPYVAHYFYVNGVLSRNNLTDFTITTGSGRSHHNYSIEIKPTS